MTETNPIEVQSKKINTQTQRLYDAGNLISEIEKALFGYDKSITIVSSGGGGGGTSTSGACAEPTHVSGAIETLESETVNLLSAADYLTSQLAKLHNRLIGQ